MKKLSLITKILLHLTLCIYGIIAVAGSILLANKGAVNSFFGVATSIGTSNGSDDSMYFNTKFKTMNEVKDATKKIIEETMEEGAVLLKNDNGALPLEKGDSVNMYGIASYYTVITGQGSGVGGNATGMVSLFDGLTSAGLKVNATMNDWYKNLNDKDYIAYSGESFIGSKSQDTQYVVKDTNWNELPSAKNDKAKAGIVVFARNSGEDVDLYMDTTMDDGATRTIISKGHNGDAAGSVGDALALSDNEKSMLEGLKALKQSGKIDSIIVLMNSASPLMCDFLNDDAYGIDACMWVGAIGTYGANAIGRLLVGDVNPSGRTADTFWANSKFNPVYYNYGSIEYNNSDVLKGYQGNDDKHYIVYQEGIYNGYKYTETRYEDVVTSRGNAGSFDYGSAVAYPFGYGLSYSDFSYSNMRVKENGDATYTVTVDVKNNSAKAGKEVVQVYLQKPYTAKDIANGVEKASVELVGFTKVAVDGNATVSVEITIEEKYFAAYDANIEKTYVIGSDNENDKYLLTAAKDSHDAINNILQYKSQNGISVDSSKIVKIADRDNGDSALVWGKYIKYDNKTYSTNEFIESENKVAPAYEGAEVNYGVNSITNKFDDVDFKKAKLFSDTEAGQTYMSRNDWAGTYGKQIKLTATEALAEAQKCEAAPQDDTPYPKYGEVGFYEEESAFDEIKLIYLRGKDYNDPLWTTLLDRMTWEETCYLLQEGFRFTNGVESIVAPSSSQQNGGLGPVVARTDSGLPSQSGFRGFAELLDAENKNQKPAIFVCNGIVAATYNVELIERLGEQTGEEGAWAGFNGIYGLGVNIHRGAYCGRTFEYYSEDGFLTGTAAGYEAAGAHKLGMFVLMKHAILNDQETHRAGVNVWANEQSIREIYSRAIEVAVEIDSRKTPSPVLGVMTGMNRMGAKWTGAHGFCNTVLRAEYGMRGFVISDYNSSRIYMSPVAGVLNGNDLPDGQPAGNDINKTDKDGNNLNFKNYETGYGKLAWAMRDSAHKILYTIANSNTMNGFSGKSSIVLVTPTWERAVPIITRVALTLFIWAAAAFGVVWVINYVSEKAKSKEGENLEGPKEP